MRLHGLSELLARYYRLLVYYYWHTMIVRLGALQQSQYEK